MANARSKVEALGWQFVANQDGYVRAEKYTASGELVTFAGVVEKDVTDAALAWETYPIQAPGTRGVAEAEAPAPAPVEPAGDVAA